MGGPGTTGCFFNSPSPVSDYIINPIKKVSEFTNQLTLRTFRGGGQLKNHPVVYREGWRGLQCQRVIDKTRPGKLASEDLSCLAQIQIAKKGIGELLVNSTYPGTLLSRHDTDATGVV